MAPLHRYFMCASVLASGGHWLCLIGGTTISYYQVPRYGAGCITLLLPLIPRGSMVIILVTAVLVSCKRHLKGSASVVLRILEWFVVRCERRWMGSVG